LSGLSALTGKANFDISEWMLIRLLEEAAARRVTMAMLCKSAVARRTLVHVWRTGIRLKRAAMYGIDSKRSFGAAVDACLLVCDTTTGDGATSCDVYKDIDPKTYQTSFGFSNGQLIASIPGHQKWGHLQCAGDNQRRYRWRSGIKHDCSKVMELRRKGDEFVNGLAEVVSLEYDYLYPMLKSSDISNGARVLPERWMLVPQKRIGGDTSEIAEKAPKTWRYLDNHHEMLDSRKSSLYRGKPRYSVFGVGEYTFAHWKVAISGLYKKLMFTVVGPVEGKAVVFDDTCNFLPCETEGEARLLAQMLASDIAMEFYEAFIFWDAKRPITVEILNRLDIMALAAEMKLDANLKACQAAGQAGTATKANQQLRLL
jgi:hypothetical protein